MILPLHTFPSFLLKFTADLGHTILLYIILWRDDYLPSTRLILQILLLDPLAIIRLEPFFWFCDPEVSFAGAQGEAFGCSADFLGAQLVERFAVRVLIFHKFLEFVVAERLGLDSVYEAIEGFADLAVSLRFVDGIETLGHPVGDLGLGVGAGDGGQGS
jgi:hypothetical protein